MTITIICYKNSLHSFFDLQTKTRGVIVNIKQYCYKLYLKTAMGKCYMYVSVLVSMCVSSTNSNTMNSRNKVRSSYLPEDGVLSFPDLAMKYIGRYEDHEVITEDGYILKLFNIPGEATRPVLLIHGFSGSTDDYITRGNTSLAVSLARAGYDVWLGNLRGNYYSRRHITLDPDKDPQFWNFTFHEHGFDISTIIDFIIQKTGESAVRIVGISQGSTSVFTLTSTRPEYNAKIKVLVALAPIAYFRDLPQPFPIVAQFSDVLLTYLQTMGMEEIGGRSSQPKAMTEFVCAQRIFYPMCMNWLFFPLVGYDPLDFEDEFVPILFAHTMFGTSRKNLVHYAQLMKSRKFQQFDYGPMRNMRVYRRWSPPEYDFNKMTMDTYLLAGKNDKMATPSNVALLQQKLPNCKRVYSMESLSFNHVGFTWGRTGHRITFKYVMEIFNKYD